MTLMSMKIQDYLTAKVNNSLIASLLFPALPIIAVGVCFECFFEYRIFSRGVAYSFIWLIAAPFLVKNADKIIVDFFESQKNKFTNEIVFLEIKDKYLSIYENHNYIFLNILWVFSTTLIIVFTIFNDAVLPIKIWAFISYAILFSYSFIGFKGILLIPYIVKEFCSGKAVFDPLHYDGFGGLESIGKFIIKGTLFFSTGSLVLPLVFSILRDFAELNVLLSYSVYILTVIFLFILLYSFIAPILTVKKYLQEQKEKAIDISDKKLDALYKGAFSDGVKLEKAAQIYFYNEIYHKKIMDIKEFPYDASVIFELTVSVLLPIGIAMLETLCHS